MSAYRATDNCQFRMTLSSTLLLDSFSHSTCSTPHTPNASSQHSNRHNCENRGISFYCATPLPSPAYVCVFSRKTFSQSDCFRMRNDNGCDEVERRETTTPFHVNRAMWKIATISTMNSSCRALLIVSIVSKLRGPKSRIDGLIFCQKLFDCCRMSLNPIKPEIINIIKI